MDSSILSYGKNMYDKLRESVMSSNYRSPYTLVDDGNDEDDEESVQSPSNMFFSVQTPNPESIPMTDSRAFYDERINNGEDTSELFDSDYRANQYSDGDLGYSDFSYTRMSEFQSDAEEQPQPSAIYLDVPPPVVSSNSQKRTLAESLLPTTSAIPADVTTVKPHMKLKDPFFAFLYIISFLIFTVSGLVILFTTDSHAIEDFSRGTVFIAIKGSAGILAIMFSLALAVSAIWIILLRKYARYLIWGTIAIVPVVTFAMFLWTIIESFQRNFIEGSGPTGHDTRLTIMSFFPLITGILYLRILFGNKEKVEHTLTVFELACDVLRANPEAVLLSVSLMGVFVAFSSLWIALFSRLWLIGHSISPTTPSGIEWVVNNNVYLIATFYIFFYLWTASLLINVQRFSLAGVTAQWYFHRHEPVDSITANPSKAALTRACTSSLGTVALGALLVSIVQTFQVISVQVQKRLKSSNIVFGAILGCLKFIEMIVGAINNETIILAGITGESFLASARSVTKVFRRNLISGVLEGLLTRMILNVSALMLSLFSGFATYIFVTRSLHSPHGMIVGFLAAVVPFYISRFFTSLLNNIIDALFVSYAIDLDTNTVHCNAAHKVFGNLS
ncbi:plasma-membrane choline transporter-domain-containing protein [Umbelopsis sp. PMI_123]|nr:plasma-membrane choline transporter-domain-containing protein [Umbelopsis sp. PMI_123]